MKKFLLTLLFGFIMTINFNAQTQELDTSDRVKIVENMNKYAIGIDTKDYELFRSIFLKHFVNSCPKIKKRCSKILRGCAANFVEKGECWIFIQQEKL